MRRRSALALIIAVFLAASTSFAAAQNEPPESGWGELPAGTTFEPIAEGTLDDLTTAAALVRVSRQTWGPDANVAGACFDLTTGGPEIVYVESGSLRFHVGAPIRDTGTQPVGGLPLLSRAGDDGIRTAPVVVVPDTWLDLQAGDLVAMPNGTDCGKYGGGSEVVYLMIEGFPEGPPPTSYADLEMVSEPLDLDLGVATARPAAPPVMVTGRLTVEPGVSIELGKDTAPLLFAVEDGALDLTIGAEGGIVRRTGVESYQPSKAIQPDTPTTLRAGDAAYIPPASDGSLTSAGDGLLTVFSVAVVPPSAD